ncbi:MAG: hypothetical protein ACJAUC_004219, partial [Planctomycetota bacterium]
HHPTVGTVPGQETTTSAAAGDSIPSEKWSSRTTAKDAAADSFHRWRAKLLFLVQAPY